MVEDVNQVEIGKIGRPHGVRGEVRIFTDVDSQTLARIESISLTQSGAARRSYALRRAKRASRFWIVALEGVQDRDAAAALTGAHVWVDRAALPEPADDEFYACDLVGSRVITADGERESVLGEVRQVFDNGAHEVLVVATADGSEVMIPFVEDFVLDVDLDEGEIRTRPVELV